jgi:DNA-binding FrmR family transcriptional regulator
VPRVVNPLGIVSLPAEIVAHLRVLPRIAERLASVSRHTEGINYNTDVLEQVAADTKALSDLRVQMARIDQRMETIEAAMPVLVEVQQHLAQLPEAIERLCVLMEGLQDSLEPIGRVAGRLPGQRRGARQ